MSQLERPSCRLRHQGSANSAAPSRVVPGTCEQVLVAAVACQVACRFHSFVSQGWQ